MPVKVYRSSDAGAPTLDGSAGSLIAVLKACLVDGYGAKTGAGWTMPFSAGAPITKAVFKQGAFAGPPTRPQYHLRVVDDGSLAAGGREAAVRGYETMSDVDTGTGEFPTVAQRAGGMCVRKSHDANAKTWILVADHRTFTLLVYHPSGYNTNWGSRPDGWTGFHFGDYVPANPNFQYPCVLVAKDTFNSVVNDNFNVVEHPEAISSYGVCFLARDYSGASTSKAAVKWVPALSVNLADPNISGDWSLLRNQPGQSDSPVNALLNAANPADGRIWVARYLLITGEPAVVGWLRGLWAPCHYWDAYADGSTSQGAGQASGRRLEYHQPTRWQDGSTSSLARMWHGGIYVETSDTWDV